MAQIPSDPRVNQYTATAGQTTFTYDFKIYDDDEIIVQQNQTTLTLTTHYTVTDAGEDAGGTIVLVTGASEDDIITLTGNTMIERGTTFTQGGDILSSAINGELNRLDNLISEQTTAASKNLKLAVYNEDVSTIVPAPSAGLALKWNAEENALELSDYDPDEMTTISSFFAEMATYYAEQAYDYSEDSYDYSQDASDFADAASGYADDASGYADAASGYADDAAASAAAFDISSIAGDIIPDADGTRDLGSAAKEWAEVHATDGFIYDDLSVGGDASVTGDVSCATLTLGTVPSNIQPTIQYAWIMDLKAQNTAPDSIANADWRTLVLNTLVASNITGCSLASNQVTLPAGTYEFHGTAGYYVAAGSGGMLPRLYNVTGSAEIDQGGQCYVASDAGHCHVDTVTTFTVETLVEFQAYVTTTGYAGPPQMNITTERYTSLFIKKVA